MQNTFASNSASSNNPSSVTLLSPPCMNSLKSTSLLSPLLLSPARSQSRRSGGTTPVLSPFAIRQTQNTTTITELYPIPSYDETNSNDFLVKSSSSTILSPMNFTKYLHEDLHGDHHPDGYPINGYPIKTLARSQPNAPGNALGNAFARYSCLQCNSSFFTEQLYYQHLSSVHPQISLTGITINGRILSFEQFQTILSLSVQHGQQGLDQKQQQDYKYDFPGKKRPVKCIEPIEPSDSLEFAQTNPTNLAKRIKSGVATKENDRFLCLACLKRWVRAAWLTGHLNTCGEFKNAQASLHPIPYFICEFPDSSTLIAIESQLRHLKQIPNSAIFMIQLVSYLRQTYKVMP